MTFSGQPVKKSRVAIVAAGVVSPLGVGMSQTVQRLELGTDCVSRVTRFSVEQCRCRTAGQIPDEPLFQASGMTPRRARRAHRASHMMTSALKEALRADPAFTPESAIIGTTSGGMSFGEEYFRKLKSNGPMKGSARLVSNYPPQKPVIDALCECELDATHQVIANACASGTNAIGDAFHAIRSGRYQRVLAGGYDAISELVFVGFDSLQASTPDKCRPFDRDRSGMVLGEGAAVLALEEMESATARGAKILGEIVGYGLSTDNHHLTQPNPSGIGPRMAMERALKDANLTAAEIDYINAHGTATPFNDAAEGIAIEQLFGDRVPVSSTKSMMGHSLGAAGAIEAVISLIALTHDLLPPNLHFNRPDETIHLNIIARPGQRTQLNVALSNSFGFGGTNASILMRKVALS